MLAPVPARSSSAVLANLTPLMGVVLVGFLVIGMAMPVLPLHVHDSLGFGPVVVGLVTGSQFIAALAARLWAGRLADQYGAKRAVLIGLAGSMLAGLLYLVSLGLESVAAVAVLLLGRGVLGAGESFIITGATVWGLARAGTSNAGKVIAWIGTAMFAAFAGGAPLGTALYASGGFAAVALATVLAPLVTLLLLLPVVGAEAAPRGALPLLGVVRRIWLPGLAAALSSFGFGAIITFSALLFAGHGWHPVWLPFTAYAVALILARVLCGHLPDRLGGVTVALASLVIETSGLVLMGLAGTAALATAGAALTGLGYALVFPGFGIAAVRRGPPDSRGVAMGAYTACLDLALGLSGPGLGLVASHSGFGAVFLVSAGLVASAIAVGLPQREKTDR